DVAARVNSELAHLRLLRRHVLEGANNLAELREHGPLGEPLLSCLGHAEIDDLCNGLAIVQTYQNIGRFQIAMNDALLMSVLNGLTDRNEQLQALAYRQVIVVAVLGDGNAMDQLHDKKRPTVVGGAGVKDPGNVLVVHHGQRLTLGLEAGDDLGTVHARLDDLEGNAAMDGFMLLGHVDYAESAFADLLQ